MCVVHPPYVRMLLMETDFLILFCIFQLVSFFSIFLFIIFYQLFIYLSGGRDIKRENAMSHVFGYTIANDVTARDIQKKHVQWFKGNVQRRYRCTM